MENYKLVKWSIILPDYDIEVKKKSKKKFPQKIRFLEIRKKGLISAEIDGFDCFKRLICPQSVPVHHGRSLEMKKKTFEGNFEGFGGIFYFFFQFPVRINLSYAMTSSGKAEQLKSEIERTSDLDS